MSDVFDICVRQEGKPDRESGEAKVYWNQIGVMFDGENRDGRRSISIKLHMHPDLTIYAFPRDKDRERGGSRGDSQDRGRPAARRPAADDDVPF